MSKLILITLISMLLMGGVYLSLADNSEIESTTVKVGSTISFNKVINVRSGAGTGYKAVLSTVIG